MGIRNNDNASRKKLADLIVDITNNEKKVYDKGRSKGEVDGFNQGQAAGYEAGHTVGSKDGYRYGYDRGYEVGFNSGENHGYNSGHQLGKEEGYTEGYTEGVASKQPEIDDMMSAMDDILVMQEEIVGVTEITFSISYYVSTSNKMVGHTFKAQRRMTWAEWCQSDYNTGDAVGVRIFIDGQSLRFEAAEEGVSGGIYFAYPDVYTRPSDVIEGNHGYYCPGW